MQSQIDMIMRTTSSTRRVNRPRPLACRITVAANIHCPTAISTGVGVSRLVNPRSTVSRSVVKAANPAHKRESLARCADRRSSRSHLVNRTLSAKSKKASDAAGLMWKIAGTSARRFRGRAQFSTKLKKDTIRTVRLSTRGRL